MSETPRAWTQKEVQEKFMYKMWDLVDYWDKQNSDQSTRDRLEGLLHSILITLDGCSELPAFEVIPYPHETDKNYCIKEENNYYGTGDEGVTVHGGDMLHECMYKYGRQFGFVK